MLRAARGPCRGKANSSAAFWAGWHHGRRAALRTQTREQEVVRERCHQKVQARVLVMHSPKQPGLLGITLKSRTGGILLAQAVIITSSWHALLVCAIIKRPKCWRACVFVRFLRSHVMHTQGRGARALCLLTCWGPAASRGRRVRFIWAVSGRFRVLEKMPLVPY